MHTTGFVTGVGGNDVLFCGFWHVYHPNICVPVITSSMKLNEGGWIVPHVPGSYVIFAVLVGCREGQCPNVTPFARDVLCSKQRRREAGMHLIAARKGEDFLYHGHGRRESRPAFREDGALAVDQEETAEFEGGLTYMLKSSRLRRRWLPMVTVILELYQNHCIRFGVLALYWGLWCGVDSWTSLELCPEFIGPPQTKEL
jgi:hypothetical protein